MKHPNTVSECNSCMKVADDLLLELFGMVCITKGEKVDPRTQRGLILHSDDMSKALSASGQKSGEDVMGKVGELLDERNALSTPRKVTAFAKKANRLLTAQGKILSATAGDVIMAKSETLAPDVRGSAQSTVGIDKPLSKTQNNLVKKISSKNRLFIADNWSKSGDKAQGFIEQSIGLELPDMKTYVTESMASFAFNENYWKILGSSSVVTIRTLVELLTYSDSGASQYQLNAILDSVTGVICDALHGVRFNVSDGLGLFDSLAKAKTAEAYLLKTPWVKAGKRIGNLIATIGNSEFEFDPFTSNNFMINEGIMWPPFHPHCRTQADPV